MSKAPSEAPSEAPPRFRAACTPSGDVVALGMAADAVVHCAGRALVRVARGSAEVLGFRPRPGVYYALHSPRWSSLLELRGAGAGDGSIARFGAAAARLLRLSEPAVAAALPPEAADEELAADELAARLAAGGFPVVLVLRAVPASLGNVSSFFESAVDPLGSAFPAVLPGFKLVVARHQAREWHELAAGWELAAAPADPAASHAWKPPSRVFAELAVVDSLRALRVPDGWRAAADALERALLPPSASPLPTEPGGRRVVVCGAKGSGKSTFCRFLVNRLLARAPVVGFLDTDLGQPELTPPGLVSLHALAAPLLGPGFTDARAPLRAFFCGATSPSGDPLRFAAAVRRLLRLREATPRLAAAPLVVNTDGWVKGLGHDLLCLVIQEARPAHVVQLLAASKSKQFAVPTGGGGGGGDDQAAAWQVLALAPWDPTGTAQAARSAKETRLYRLHAYFLSARLAGDQLARDRLRGLHVLAEKNRMDADLARAYARRPPLAVPFDAVDVAFAGAAVPPSQLLYALDAALVGLCARARRPPRAAADANGPPRVVLGPVDAPCLGLGIVRAVDARRRLLLVVSPLPPAALARVNLLVRSSIPLDPLLLAGAADAGAGSYGRPPRSPYVVADVVAPQGTGSAVMQSRNNLKRKRDDRAGRP